MELQFQNQPKQLLPATKQPIRIRGGSNNKSKFVGVRQRPSGKWVAEIKNTTQKIRMWLGTFDTAEEAARAYDEAACLLRGSNTRTNFVDPGPANSPLSLKIRNLLNQKRASKQNLSFSSHTITKPTSQNGKKASSLSESGQISSTSPSPASSGLNLKQESSSQVFEFDDGYKPDLSHFGGGVEMGCSYVHQFDQPVFAGELERILLNPNGSFEVPKWVGLGNEITCEQPRIPEFEHMRVERQISASLYAMNGVNEYWESVQDSSDAFWDLPMFSQMFCPS
ncbi:hypothetical protein NMG60_11033124 [Bertholletia excelsa]